MGYTVMAGALVAFAGAMIAAIWLPMPFAGHLPVALPRPPAPVVPTTFGATIARAVGHPAGG